MSPVPASPLTVQVALPVPVAHPFTYRIDGDHLPPPGTRVRVPFGRRERVGWVVGGGPTSGDRALKPVREVLDAPDPALRPELLELCRWIAGYYATPLGFAIRSALPAVLGREAAPPRDATRRVVSVAVDALPLGERDRLFSRARRQREAFEMLEAAGGSIPLGQLLGDGGFSRSVVSGLEGKDLVVIEDEVVHRDPFGAIPIPDAPRIRSTPDQQSAIDRLVAGIDEPVPLPYLLHGITGSGKTHVYVEVLDQVLSRGRTGIVLVPEISLTPQTVGRFRARFGDDVAVLHSGLSDGERYDAWKSLRAGERRVAIGARSAVFAPLDSLGAIIVDEEHEGTYKQSEAPRYHARDVAVVRARASGALCILGSATPSLESWANAEAGKYHRIDLPERVSGGALPPVRIVDLRRRVEGGPGPRSSGAVGPRILSDDLSREVAIRLDRGEQTILLLNRRGYSSFVQCLECGEVTACPQCSISLTFHRRLRTLLCHHCRHREPVSERCGRCGSTELSYRGLGTEQVERVVTETFPDARVARMDVDTTSGRWTHHEILGRVGRGEVDILLGTQMIAKGLDFPNVTLVGVINADVGLHLPDFRASERTFQLLAQVAGRTGRGPKGGEVIVQTAVPQHYAIGFAVHHDYPAFAARELEERREPAYPPHLRLINVVVSSPDEEVAASAAEAAARAARSMADPSVGFLGPAPAPIERLHGRWRWHFLMRGASVSALGSVATFLALEHRARGSDVRVAVDRDPVALL